jgi:hypothetical protein
MRQQNFFPISPSEAEGVKPQYILIANEILNTNKYDKLKFLSSDEIEIIVNLIKKYIEKKNININENKEINDDKKMEIIPEFIPEKKQTYNVHDIIIQKQDFQIENIDKKNNNIFENTEIKNTEMKIEEIQKEINNIKIQETKNENDEKKIIINDEEYIINEYVEPINYNDILLSLKNPIYNAVGVKINNCDITQYQSNIINNLLNFNYYNQNIQIQIPKKIYTIQTLLNELNNILQNKNIDIHFELRSDNHISIQSNQEFTLYNTNNSILTHLGFVDNLYSENNEYTSDNKFDLENPVYLQLIFNGKKKLMYNYEINKNLSEIKMFTEPIDEIEKIIFRIIQKENTLYDLGCIAPNINITIINNE